MPVAITARTTGIQGMFNESMFSSSAIHANAKISSITASAGNFFFAIL